MLFFFLRFLLVGVVVSVSVRRRNWCVPSCTRTSRPSQTGLSPIVMSPHLPSPLPTPSLPPPPLPLSVSHHNHILIPLLFQSWMVCMGSFLHHHRQPFAAAAAVSSHGPQATGAGAGAHVPHPRRGPAGVPRPAPLREENHPVHRQETQQTTAVTTQT